MEKKQTYLVTGGAGFIGSYLCESLLAQGHRVYVIDDLSTGSYNNIEHLANHERFQFARSSIVHEQVLDRMASDSDVIVHLAAAVGVDLVVRHPVHTIETNVIGTEKVLKAALRYGCRTLIASTSEVYGKGVKIPFSEDNDVLLGSTAMCRWGYAASKMVDEFLGLAYVREFDLDVRCFRLFNTVGPRQTGAYGMVVPNFVGSALRGQAIRVFGDGTQARCFGHVEDIVVAIERLAQKDDLAGTVVNFGGTEEVSILQLAGRVKEMTGSKSDIELIPYEQAYAPGFEDMARRVPDISRAKQLLDWQPTRTLEDILRDVIKYERAKQG